MNLIRSMSRSARLVVGTTVVALAGALALGAAAMPGGHHHGAHGMGYGFPMGRMVERMLDGANATDEQRARVRQIVEAAAADLKGQREAASALRQRSIELFTQPTVDANAAEQLRQQMLREHDQASERVLKAMLAVSEVLTPQQRAQLAEKMKQRREMHERHRRERQSLDQPRS